MQVFQDLEIQGDLAAIRQWLDLATDTQVPGWYRDQRREEKLPSYFCFSRTASDDLPEVTLYLIEQARGLKVANVVPVGENLTIARYNQVLREFHDRVAAPLAANARVELRLSSDTLELDDVFPPRVLQKLRDFSMAGIRTGASHPSDRERWLEFVVAAYRERVRIGEAMLARFLEEELGWLPDRAVSLAGDYISALELLEFNESQRAAVA